MNPNSNFTPALLAMLVTLIIPRATAQSYSVLHHFSGKTNEDGATPAATMILSGSTLYGTTLSGGQSDYGAIFKINTDGSGYAVLVHCIFPDAHPHGSLACSGDTLFCTTGGAQQITGHYPEVEWIMSQGTVFSVSTSGTSLHRLVDSGFYHYWWGDSPYGSPPGGLNPSTGVAYSDRGLYGTGSRWGHGTVFRAHDAGVEVLKDLTGYSRSGVVVAGNTLFGTTMDSGSNNLGTVFGLDAGTGDYAVLKEFTGPDGASPAGTLVLVGGTLYGVTESGGLFGRGTVYSMATNGSNFTVLKQFSGGDGSFPHSGLCLSGAKLFGTTGIGGVFDHGTVFQMQTNGAGFAVLKHFTGTDGEEPTGGVLVNGTALYGTTAAGGAFGQGVLFRLSLAPTLVEAAADKTHFSFTFQTFSNLTYVVEYTDAFGGNNWFFHQFITGDGSSSQCLIPMTNSGQRFFRVRQM